MHRVARETPEMSGKAMQRAQRALAARKPPRAFDRTAARAELDALIGQLGTGA